MKKHALRLLAALLAAAAVAGLAAAPIIYFKISDKLLLNREFTTDELPQIAIGSSEIEFLKVRKNIFAAQPTKRQRKSVAWRK